GINLFSMLEGTAGLLVANNTILGIQRGLCVKDPESKATGIEIQNNLLLMDQGPDMSFVGKDREALRHWRIDHNWRSIKQPAEGDPEAREWIVNGLDLGGSPPKLNSVNSKDLGFLQPPKDSPLS